MERLDATATLQIESVARLVREVLGDRAETGYLFGSAVRGGLRPDSDLDLLFIAGAGRRRGDRPITQSGLLSQAARLAR